MSLLNRNCREVTHLILARKDRDLRAVEWIAMRIHLGICKMCTRFNGQVHFMDEAMSHWKSYRENDEPRA